MNEKEMMEWRLDKIRKMEAKLNKTKNERKREKIIEKIELQKRLIDDPALADKMHQQNIDNSIFTKMGKGMESTGDKKIGRATRREGVKRKEVQVDSKSERAM